MSKILKLACAALMVAMAFPGSKSVQARVAASTNHFACARYGLAFDAPANWSLEDKVCDSEAAQEGYVSGDGNAIFEVQGTSGRTSSQALLFVVRNLTYSKKLSVKTFHFSPKVINGVKFLEAQLTDRNIFLDGSAWNLIAVTEKNGLGLVAFGSVGRSGNGHLSNEMLDITNALDSIHFTKPSQVAKPAKPAKPAPAPQAPTDVCDPESHVCASATNLHVDSGGDLPPPSGDMFVVVHVKLVNQGSQSYDYNTLDFLLKGTKTHRDYQPDAIDININDSSLNSGTLLPGDTVEGDIAFQTPSSEDSVALYWQPSLLGDYAYVPIN